MMRSLWSAASGMKAQQTNTDVIANNLANVNTTGYKTNKAEFKTLLSQQVQQRAARSAVDPNQDPIEVATRPAPAMVGLGTRVSSVTSNFVQGSLEASDLSASFAIEGKGFFQIRGADNQMYYTRSGNFSWSIGTDKRAMLTTPEGYPVLDSTGKEIKLPPNISGENASYSTNSNEMGYTDENGEFVNLGQRIGIFQFQNPAGLQAASNNRFQETVASGQAMNEANNNNLEQSKVHQYYLEMSNVNVADEMVNLIVAQRAYEMNSKAIQASDDMLGQANQLRR